MTHTTVVDSYICFFSFTACCDLHTHSTSWHQGLAPRTADLYFLKLIVVYMHIIHPAGSVPRLLLLLQEGGLCMHALQ